MREGNRPDLLDKVGLCTFSAGIGAGAGGAARLFYEIIDFGINKMPEHFYHDAGVSGGVAMAGSIVSLGISLLYD